MTISSTPDKGVAENREEGTNIREVYSNSIIEYFVETLEERERKILGLTQHNSWYL